MEKTREQFIASLRAIADWYETHPALEVPHTDTLAIIPAQGQFAAAVRELGPGEKSTAGSFYFFTRDFGGLKVQVADYRENVCQRRVTGIRTVVEERLVYPEGVRPEVQRVEREEEVVEWICPDSFLREEPTK